MTQHTQTQPSDHDGPQPAEGGEVFLPAPGPRVKLVQVLSQDVTPQVESAARQLIESGDALLVKHGRQAVHGFVLDREHFDTRVEWTPTELYAVCPCEMRAGGFVCPHIWATVLLADRSGAFRQLEEAGTHPIFSRAMGPGEGEAGPAGVAGGVGAVRRPASAWPARAGWKIHVASIAQAMAQRAAEVEAFVPGLPRQAIYLVDVAATRAAAGFAAGVAGRETAGAVMLEVQSRHQKKGRGRTGMDAGDAAAWTRAGALLLEAREIGTFSEQADRDILERVVGMRREEISETPAERANANGQKTWCALRGETGIALLKRMCDTGRCNLVPVRPHGISAGADEWIPLSWDDGPVYEFFLRVAAHDDGKHYTLGGHLKRGEVVLPVSAARLIAEPAPRDGGGEGGGVVFIGEKVARADLRGGLQWAQLLEARGTIHLPRADLQEFLRQVAALAVIPRLELPEDVPLEQITALPRARLIVRRPARGAAVVREERVLGTVLFEYETGAIEADAAAAGVYDPAAGRMMLRDRAAEGRLLAVLKGLGFRRETDEESQQAFYELPSRLLPSVVPGLIREGWVVEAEGKLYRAATDFRVSIRSGIDWFDLSGSVAFGDQVVPLPRLLAAARKGEHLIKLSDGTFGVLPEEWLAKYGVIVQSGTAVKDESGAEALRFSRAQVGMLDVLLESQPKASVDETFDNLRRELREFGGVTAKEAPQEFVGTLRPYQREGLGWFEFLRRFRFGGCLADDMGLGKTIQVLALLAGRKTGDGAGVELANGNGRNGNAAGGAGGGGRASLVVAPRSLFFNWREEAAKFSPALRILDHTGPSRERSTDHFSEYDLVLTTYGTLRSDIPFLREYGFDYAILDEAQAVKNAQTESAKAVRLLKADHRLALSGTPVQNHLGELWSLFEYLNPGMLGAAGVFDSRFGARGGGAKANKPAEETVPTAEELPAGDAAEIGTAAVVEEEPTESPRLLLSRALRPFILRRTKEQVAQDLPPCTEQTIFCQLDESQRALYDELRDHYRQTLLGAGGGKGNGDPNRMQVLEALLRLRQAACHPGLIDKTRVGEPSAKLDTLLTQIEEILEENHKALVFSQFTSLLAIVRARLDQKGVRYAYLDGKTRDRKSPVEQFQNDPTTKLFLISLKAGGLGLNLTGADYVFLLDPWWNPAVEAQAIDRAHRIGQSRHVFAYRLIASGTVEEKVLQLQQTKRDLADAIISEDNALVSGLTADDLAVLLS